MKHIGEILASAMDPENRPQRPAGEVPPAPPEEDVCPICRGMGYLRFDVPYGDPLFGKAVPCRCTEAWLAVERARAHRQLSSLGPLERLTFEGFQPDGVGLSEQVRYNLHEAYDRSLAFAQSPEGWLVLLGGYGCGKTHLAAAIANYCLGLGRPALFVVVPDLLDHLRATYAPSSAVGFDSRMESVREAPLLVLDDLGAHSSTPWAQEKLYQILNHRYNRRLPTVITSNQRLEELDPRITSRLVDPDLSQVYEMLAPDYRQPGADRGVSSLSTLSYHSDQTFAALSMRSGDLDAYERTNLKRAVELAKAFAEKPSGWLVFTGTYGCGKTHLAAAIANHQLAANRPLPLFVVVPDLLDHLRATFSPSSPTTLDRLFEQVKSAPLLVLDDLGTESASPWAREKLFQLLNHRYVARLPTVVTTTNSIEEIEPRLRSRMLDSTRCTVFALEVPSYRPNAQPRAPKKSKAPARSTP